MSSPRAFDSFNFTRYSNRIKWDASRGAARRGGAASQAGSLGAPHTLHPVPCTYHLYTYVYVHPTPEVSVPPVPCTYHIYVLYMYTYHIYLLYMLTPVGVFTCHIYVLYMYTRSWKPRCPPHPAACALHLPYICTV